MSIRLDSFPKDYMVVTAVCTCLRNHMLMVMSVLIGVGTSTQHPLLLKCIILPARCISRNPQHILHLQPRQGEGRQLWTALPFRKGEREERRIGRAFRSSHSTVNTSYESSCARNSTFGVVKKTSTIGSTAYNTYSCYICHPSNRFALIAHHDTYSHQTCSRL